MSSASAVPLLMGFMVISLLGLVSWSSWRYRSYKGSDALMGSYDGVLIGLLSLCAFALGVFMTYLLLRLGQ